MLQGVNTVMLYKDEDATEYGDISFSVLGKEINDGCYVSELSTSLYQRDFNLTMDEITKYTTLAKKLMKSQDSEIIIDL